jgi:hypothetical protein
VLVDSPVALDVGVGEAEPIPPTVLGLEVVPLP